MCTLAHTRRDIFLAQGGKCFYCGKFMKAFPGPSHGGYTVDHFYPKSKIKNSDISVRENKVLSCQPCNTKKGSKLPTRVQRQKHRRLYNLINIV